MKPKPTQKDIAREADVSQGLVSQVLNNSDVEIADATRIRIIEAAKRLGYSFRKKDRQEAKILKSQPEKQRKVIAYIPPILRRDTPHDHSIYDAYEEFYTRFQNRLLESAFKTGCNLIVHPYTDPKEITSWLIEWGVDGVILHANDKSLADWIAKRYPMVQVNRRLASESDSVMANQEEMMIMAMDYLRSHGHERIAFAAEAKNDYAINRRKQTYLDYTKEHHLPTYEEYLSYPPGGDLSALFFSKQENRPTAIITGDPTALMLQKEAVKRGLSLPHDLSVVGIDNISADVFASPPLTSIDIRIDEISRVALSLIQERLKEPTLAFQKIEITPKLIIRESVSSPSNHPQNLNNPHEQTR